MRGSALRLAAVFAAACTSGAPPGFSGGVGDRWSMPLVGPLEDGLLITAVTINTDGPYLFAIDPDAPVSLVDGELVKKLELRTFAGPKRLDESDTQHVRFMAELVGLEIGTLIVERRDAIIVRPNTYDAAGRRILGVLGRDVLADSLVWGFDRDRGLVHLITQKSFKPPADATTIVYAELPSRITNVQITPPPRRLVDATVNGVKLAMHVDLGMPASQLRAGLWDKAKLVAREVKSAVVDEVGSFHPITKASQPAEVTVADLTADDVVFVPYSDKRWQSEDLAGTIGLSFFTGHSLWQSWHTKQYFVVPRKDVAVATRINRWDSPVLAKCKNVGCVTLRITDPLAGKPVDPGKHPGLVLSITRDEIAGGMNLEVMLEARTATSPPPASQPEPQPQPAPEPAEPAPTTTPPGSTPTTPAAAQPPSSTSPTSPAGPTPPPSPTPSPTSRPTPTTPPPSPTSPAGPTPASPTPSPTSTPTPTTPPPSPTTPAGPTPTSPTPTTPAGPTPPTPTPTPTPTPSPAPLPRLLVNMPGHVDKMLYQLPASFLGTTLVVVDASPFPRDCPSQNGCVDQLAP